MLIDCVEGGASVSFMHPLTARPRASRSGAASRTAWRPGERALLVAEDAHGLCGTVQLVFDLPENQPHRADLAKMLVHRRARRQGLGAALMRAAEAHGARVRQDRCWCSTPSPAATPSACTSVSGWQRVGVIPGYALMPDGGLCGTTVFYRNLGV